MNYETRMDLSDRGSRLVAEDDAVADEQRAKKRRLWIVLGILVAGALIAALLLSSGEEQVPFAAEENEGSIPVVTVIAPGASTLQGIINATGTLAARREIQVGAVGEGGRVVRVAVEAGDWVRAGQVLAVIDRSVQNQQASAQAAQIDVAQADAELAQANLDRALQLVERGFISQADIDRLTATRDAAVARVQVARAQLAERQARNAQLNIVAPAAGLVLTRDVEAGQVVGPGSGSLFTIARGGEMELLALLGEEDLGLVNVGATGQVTPVGTDETFTCQVWQKSPIIDEQTRQGTARCAMSYDPALRPGGFASIALGSQAVVAPRLPESAVLSDDRGSYVYIVDDEGLVERRDVELGMISDEGIAIAGGLRGNERVVVRAGGFLTEGEQVRPVREGESVSDAEDSDG
ncbi:efflux RND transporter periplasmic adaptor subunit [Aurantiacibacter gangjinensis]|uniref:Secretion protein HylD n=1 Tax=Aurantiacibacter gangjinensis TaxID=502682 RepID=A0A0G9MLR3_9SPHN|nr:efflux RND transporter periplasmic adaptor subunit [Aurantiacibacter gangjinensis]APE27575.1 putative Co/Zn/Cd efflux system membrane fusion protein [Aurantiacibacter gangjinensis]KLE31615.1 secretion protein HylD [Aurantiacibacter gangjinensis]